MVQRVKVGIAAVAADVKCLCNDLRADCLKIENRIRKLEDHSIVSRESREMGIDVAEIGDHIELAFRHMEDVRMRLGKVCQYADDGVSIFDKEK